MRRQRGIGKLEFLLVVAVIGSISWAGLDRLRDLQEIGEKTAVETTLRNVQTGLRHAMAERIMRGEDVRIAEMVGSNPVIWLAKPPKGYQGECAGPPPPGKWCFDAVRRELVYQPATARHLEIGGGKKLLRWRIEPWGGENAAGRVEYVRVAPLAVFRWFQPGGE